MEKDYKKLVREHILTQQGFVRATFSGAQKGESLDWIKVIVRPVEVKGSIQLQFSYFDEKKDITKNYEIKQATPKVDELLSLPFRNIFVETQTNTVQVNISKKGKAIVNESKPYEHVEINLSHNREKHRILSVENAQPLLKAVGILTQDGKIKADMQRKYTQINEFLRLVESTKFFADLQGKPIHLVDFGCGNAYLTFAIYYYLREILKIDTYVTGVDIKSDLIERHQAKAKSLGWNGLDFKTSQISGFEPENLPDVVLALHACDTATDDALAHGIRWNAKLILCAPCCQHELQVQLSKVPTPQALLPVFQDGILFERMGDILTDTFRAAILRIMGYQTDVTQFVPIEHTAKNLMIRAVKKSPAGHTRWVEEYKNLKDFWQVTPYLEKILGETYFTF